MMRTCPFGGSAAGSSGNDMTAPCLRRATGRRPASLPARASVGGRPGRQGGGGAVLRAVPIPDDLDLVARLVPVHEPDQLVVGGQVGAVEPGDDVAPLDTDGVGRR